MVETENLDEKTINECTIEELEKSIDILENKKIELKEKIELAKLNNSQNILTGSLCTLYASVCGLLLDYQTAFGALVFGSTITYFIASQNSKKMIHNEKEYADIELSLIKRKKSLTKRDINSN